MFNYVFQAWFNELWRFDLRTYTWQQIRPNGPPPPKRALHAAVAIGDSMYVYGGLELADRRAALLDVRAQLPHLLQQRA